MRTFPKGSSAMWHTNSLKDLNLGCHVHFISSNNYNIISANKSYITQSFIIYFLVFGLLLNKMNIKKIVISESFSLVKKSWVFDNRSGELLFFAVCTNCPVQTVTHYSQRRWILPSNPIALRDTIKGNYSPKLPNDLIGQGEIESCLSQGHWHKVNLVFLAKFCS